MRQAIPAIHYAGASRCGARRRWGADLTRELALKTGIAKEDIDRSNQRMGELVAEGFPPWEAMSQAWEEATGHPYKLGEEDRVRLVLLRAVGDEDISSPSYQKEIADF